MNQDDPFASDVGIGAFAYETGGAVLRDGNWPDRLIAGAQTYGSNFYTLTYRSPKGAPDGRFRRVVMRCATPSCMP